MPLPLAFRHLVDDAAVFPPGLAPLPRAVTEHAEHLASPHAALVGPFVIGADRLAELAQLAGPELFTNGLRVSVVTAPAAIPAVLAALAATDRLVPAALEVKPDPAPPIRDQIDALAARSLPGAVYVEAPRPVTRAWEQALASAVRHGFRLKFRTGGTEAAAFPTEDEVAAWIHDTVAAGAAFKCTAGLHHAVRHTAPTTGFEHHGYLNVLLATTRACSGAPSPPSAPPSPSATRTHWPAPSPRPRPPTPPPHGRPSPRTGPAACSNRWRTWPPWASSTPPPLTARHRLRRTAHEYPPRHLGRGRGRQRVRRRQPSVRRVLHRRHHPAHRRPDR